MQTRLKNGGEGALYRSTYPYWPNMGVPPAGMQDGRSDEWYSYRSFLINTSHLPVVFSFFFKFYFSDIQFDSMNG